MSMMTSPVEIVMTILVSSSDDGDKWTWLTFTEVESQAQRCKRDLSSKRIILCSATGFCPLLFIKPCPFQMKSAGSFQ